MSAKEPHDRDAIVTNGVDVSSLAGLMRAESIDLTSPEVMTQWQAARRETYPHEEIFGEHCTLTQYIECDPEAAFNYVSNVYSLEEYTVSLRRFEHVGGGLYRGFDLIAKDTPIYMRVVTHPSALAVDHLCAWDQGLELWMRYFLRLLDAREVYGKAGTVLVWTNYKHRYYDRGSPAPPCVAEPRARSDRPWVGDLWDVFYPGHRIEANNLKAILEARYRVQG